MANFPAMDSPSTHSPPRAPRRLDAVGGALGRLVGAILLVLSLMLLAPAEARAEHGPMVGWTLEDASGQIIVGRAVIRYEPAAEAEAYALAEELPAWWSDVEQAFGRDLDDRMTIHVVRHPGRVARATGMPVWVSGVAHPPRGEIAISLHDPDGSPADLETLLRHELVHVGLYRATNGAELPRWFHEGVAESIANEISLARAENLAGAVFGSGVPSLEGLEAQFHGDAQQAAVAYAAARDFTTWLRYHDPDGAEFRQLLSQLRMGRGFEQSFQDAYGRSLAELDEDWRAGLFGRFFWFPLLGSGSLPFMLVGPIVIFAWIRRRRRLAADWARMEAEEAAEREARVERLRALSGALAPALHLPG